MTFCNSDLLYRVNDVDEVLPYLMFVADTTDGVCGEKFSTFEHLYIFSGEILREKVGCEEEEKQARKPQSFPSSKLSRLTY